MAQTDSTINTASHSVSLQLILIFAPETRKLHHSSSAKSSPPPTYSLSVPVYLSLSLSLSIASVIAIILVPHNVVVQQFVFPGAPFGHAETVGKQQHSVRVSVKITGAPETTATVEWRLYNGPLPEIPDSMSHVLEMGGTLTFRRLLSAIGHRRVMWPRV